MIMKKIAFAASVGVMLSLLSTNAAHAQILLTIDDSNPYAVIITATGALPNASAGPVPIADGIDLLNFFTNNVTPSAFPDFSPANNPPTPTLTTDDTSSGLIFTEFTSDNYSGVNYQDLNLLNNNDDLSQTITFTATQGDVIGQPAFKGSLSLNLFGTPLPAVGSKGTIITGFSLTAPNNTLIGGWEVVSAPEPSNWILILGGLGVLVFLRRRGVQA